MLSEQILIDRAGNFTASENHKLMAGWDKPELPEPELIEHLSIYKGFKKKPLISDFKSLSINVNGVQNNEMWAYLQSKKTSIGLITYAQEKATETLFDYDPSLNFSTIATRNGEEREVECVEKLSDATGLNFVNIVDEQVHIHANNIGCTPDGIVLDNLDLVLTGCEVKCKSPLAHAKSLLINNNEDLLKNEFEHYTQIQTQMLVTDTDHWYFANFNPYAKTKKLQFKYIIIKRDDVFIKVLKERIDIAKKIKAEFLEQFSKIGLL